MSGMGKIGFSIIATLFLAASGVGQEEKKLTVEELVKKTTFRIEDRYRVGGNCLYIAGENETVIVITPKRVLERMNAKRSRVFDLQSDLCGCFTARFVVNVEVRKAGQKVWVESDTHDIAALYYSFSPSFDILDELGIDRFLTKEDFLDSAEFRKSLAESGEPARVFGYPVDATNCVIPDLIENEFTQVTEAQDCDLSDETYKFKMKASHCLLADYVIPEERMGYSGSPVYYGDHVVGIHCCSLADKGQSVIVPAEEILRVVEELEKYQE
jgi:hypothetical protein